MADNEIQMQPDQIQMRTKKVLNIMDMTTIKEVAWIGDDYLQGEIKGIVLSFHGLNGGLKGGPNTEEVEWARNGGLVVYPYYGPWAWMNREARAFVDELVDSVCDVYGVSHDAPLICTGGSMGGQASLLYTRYSKWQVNACLANCPVCDLAYHFHERPDLPTSIRCAYRGYPEDLDTVLGEHSPLAQVDAMPDIPYLIIHGESDKSVSKPHHSDKMVAAMRDRDVDVTYVEVPQMGHCGPLPLNVIQQNVEFVASALAK